MRIPFQGSGSKPGSASELHGLKSLCENVLHLLTTTVEIMEEVGRRICIIQFVVSFIC